MTIVCLAGATGLVGGLILKTLQDTARVSEIHAFTRRPLSEGPKVMQITSTDSSAWAAQFPTSTDVFISALGTTRANAGGFENQRKIDYDLNMQLAQAARAAGTKTYVLVSTSAADSSSLFGYLKMKGELEDDVKKIGFEHVVVLRPGLIVGERAPSDRRTAEAALQMVARLAERVGGHRYKDFWAQDALTIARATTQAGLDCKEPIKVVDQAGVVRLGRTEWQA